MTKPLDATPPPSGKRDFAHLLTHSMEDYIKTIYKLQQHQERATTIAIAAQMEFSAASVTNMLQKLERLGLVEYARYQGATLTPTGERIALEIIRHHRLIELYLAKQMGYTWDQVDAEAEQLEHVISEEFEDRIDAILGYPTTDPHGHPIPSRDGTIRHAPDCVPINRLNHGQSGVVRRVNDHDPALLRRLGEVGLYLGATAELLSHPGGAASLTVRIGGRTHELLAEHAEHVFVEIVDASE